MSVNISADADVGLQVKLTQLDLSFNTISSICGLQNLTALQDLSLFSNNISSLEGLEPLSQLCALSMGKWPFHLDVDHTVICVTQLAIILKQFSPGETSRASPV